MDNVLTFFIGASGITTALIFIAKFTIKWIGDAGLEKYKNELKQESQKHQSNLDKDLEKFKIKYAKLHLEQVEIIKLLYSKLIKAEKPLEYLLRPIKVNPSKTNEEIAEEVIHKANDFFDYFEENEVIFNDDTCKIIRLIKDDYLKVWGTYNVTNFMGGNLSGEMLKKLATEMKDAYENILKGEMQSLKQELKIDFRKQLGIIE